jgi:hypothetical protein
MQRVIRASLLLGLASCASGASRVAPSSEQAGQCSVRLAPRPAEAALFASQPTPRAAPQSLLVVHGEIPLAPLQQMLEARIQHRLAEGSVRIGPGGTVSYSADRGSLSISVSRTALVIETPVTARAEACRGARCYASCEPEALVRAEVPLMLRPDYRFDKASVSVRFRRGCKVRALGGFLTLDVTPTLEAQLAPELEKIARDIDKQLPDVAGQVEKAWAQLSAPRPLPLGGCFCLVPRGVVQGPFLASSQVLRARFALLAAPELRSACGEPPAAQPLPPLQADLSLSEEGVVRLGLVTPLSSIERAFESAQPAAASGKHWRIARAAVTARGSDVAAELVLDGDVCGNVALEASPSFTGDGQMIGLARPQMTDGERARLSDGGIDPARAMQALASAPRITPLLSVSAFRDTAPGLASALSQPAIDVSAQVSSARAAGAIARGDQLVAWLEARGGLWLKARAEPP